MEEKKVELSLGEEIAKGIACEMCGLGAGVIALGAASTLADLVPGGKVLKMFLKFGAFGLELATYFEVKNAVGEYADAVFDTIHDLQKILGGSGKKNEPEKVQVEGAVN